MYSAGPRAHREPPGGPCEPFFVQIKQPGQSNRIREHTGNLSAEARKDCFFFPLSVKIRGFFSPPLSSVVCKRSGQQGNDRTYSRGCSPHTRGIGIMIEEHAAARTRTHSGTLVAPVTAPMRNGFLHQTDSPHPPTEERRS